VWDTPHFVVMSDVEDEALMRSVCEDLEILRRAFEERFPPAVAASSVGAVRVFARYADYLAAGGRYGTDGVWDAERGGLLLGVLGPEELARAPHLRGRGPLPTLYHESLHQYLYEAHPGVTPAPWFGEGYGEYYAAAVVDRDAGVVADVAVHPQRVAWVRRAARRDVWPDLEHLLGMEQGVFYGPRVMENYAAAWGLAWFLENERRAHREWGRLPDRYLVALRDAARDRTGVLEPDSELRAEALRNAVAGIDLVALRAAWIEAMRRL